MRILFVNTNRYKFLAPAPIGAMIIVDRLKKDGHTIRFLDLMHSKSPKNDIESAVRETQPELLCFTIRNRDTQESENYIDPLPEIVDLVSKTVSLCDAPSLIGGTAVSTFPSQMRRAVKATYAFAGDDPELVSRFVASISRGEPDTTIPGLVYELDGIEQSNKAIFKGYRGQRFSGYEMLDLKKYRKGYYDCGVVTHTGCPMDCFFCDVHLTFGRDYILRDPDEVIDEMKELKEKHGAKSLWMVNAGINRPLDYAKELMSKIAEAQVGIGFSCIIEPGDFDLELARLMRRAGCQVGMIFGTTLDDHVLEKNGLYYRSADILDIARLMDSAGISYMLSLMFGSPGETIDTVEESLRKTLQIKPVYIQYGVGFRIQPDTELMARAVRENLVEPDFDSFDTYFYCSPTAPPEKIRASIKKFERAHILNKFRMVTLYARMVRDSLFGFG